MDLDNVDRGILFLLQHDARDTTALEMADRLDVSASTVRNRIEKLETNDVVRGYYPHIDYENAGLTLRTLFIVTVPPAERSDIVEDLLGIRGVVTVREVLSGRRNIHVETVAKSRQQLSRITDFIHEFDATIDRTEIVNQHRMQPLSVFEEAFDSTDDPVSQQESS